MIVTLYSKRKLLFVFSTVCPAGKTGSPCANCPVNTYKDQMGAGSCTPCAPGKTTNGTEGATAASACGRAPFGINFTSRRQQLHSNIWRKRLIFALDLSFILCEVFVP